MEGVRPSRASNIFARLSPSKRLPRLVCDANFKRTHRTDFFTSASNLLDIAHTLPGVLERPRTAGKLRYIPQLDGLRAVAISLVLLHHVFTTWFWAPAPRALVSIAHYGVVGVDIFFVLSGYLITSILLRSGGGLPALRHFYFKRILRIWPIYYLLLSFVIIEAWWTRTPYQWAHCLVFVQNYLTAWPTHPDFNQTWSLCVEEHFYLVWPLLVLFLPRRVLPAIAAAVVFASPLVRLLGLHSGMDLKQLYSYTQYRLDGIALGSLLALLTLNSRSVRRIGWLTFVPCLAAALWTTMRLGALAPVRVALADSFFALAFFGLLCLTLEYRPLAAALSIRPLRYIGRISYGLYMIHPFVFGFAGRHVAGLGGILLGIALSTGVAALSWKFMEYPILQLGRDKTGIRRPRPLRLRSQPMF